MPTDDDLSQPAPSGYGAGLAVLLIGAALGAAAALLVAQKSERPLWDTVAERVADWKAQAAEALAQGREKVISAVESSAGESATAPPADVPVTPSVRERAEPPRA